MHDLAVQRDHAAEFIAVIAPEHVFLHVQIHLAFPAAERTIHVDAFSSTVTDLQIQKIRHFEDGEIESKLPFVFIAASPQGYADALSSKNFAAARRTLFFPR